jgi:DNA-directed RNA polymerase subunit omega
MARLTIEDCLTQIDNRYDLVLLASKRARQITLGRDTLVDEDNDKPTVIALREIAEGLITPENIDTIGKIDLLDEFSAVDEGEETAPAK